MISSEGPGAFMAQSLPCSSLPQQTLGAHTDTVGHGKWGKQLKIGSLLQTCCPAGLHGSSLTTRGESPAALQQRTDRPCTFILRPTTKNHLELQTAPSAPAEGQEGAKAPLRS